jgi:hypothetical protein
MINSNISVKYDIIPFDGTNFLHWERNVKWLLIEHQLGDTLKKYCKDGTKSVQALAKIGRNMIPALQPHLDGIQTVREALVKLKELFQQKTIANQLYLLDELIDGRIMPGEAVSTYAMRMKGIRDQLVICSGTCDDSLLSALIIRGLPESFECFKKHVRLLENLTLEKLSALLDQEAKAMISFVKSNDISNN